MEETWSSVLIQREGARASFHFSCVGVGEMGGAAGERGTRARAERGALCSACVSRRGFGGGAGWEGPPQRRRPPPSPPRIVAALDQWPAAAVCVCVCVCVCSGRQAVGRRCCWRSWSKKSAAGPPGSRPSPLGGARACARRPPVSPPATWQFEKQRARALVYAHLGLFWGEGEVSLVECARTHASL